MITMSPPSESRAKARLLVLGLLSLVVYAVAFTLPYPLGHLAAQGAPADIGAISGYEVGAAARYVGSLIVLFVLYGAAIVAARDSLTGVCPPGTGPAKPRDHRQALWIVFGVGAAAAILLSLVYPYAAADVFLYVVRGRVLGVFGLNSSLMPPDHTPLQGYLPFASEWAAVPSPYGPVWEWIAAGLARVGERNLATSLLAFKGWAALCYLGSGLLVSNILRREQPTGHLSGLVAMMWNPLVLLETMAMGHNDIFMVFFVLLALWFMAHGQHWGIYVALTLGALVKYVPLMLVPPTLIWVWRRVPNRVFWKHLLGGLLVALLLAALIWWPLWPGWHDLPFLKQMNRGHFSLGTWIVLLLRKIFPGGNFYIAGMWVTRAAFALAYARIIASALVGRGRLAELYERILYAWLLFGAFAFGYWSITWLVALMPFQRRRQVWLRIALFCFAGLFSVALYTYGDAWFSGHMWDLQLIGGIVVFGLPWLLARLLDRATPTTRGIPFV